MPRLAPQKPYLAAVDVFFVTLALEFPYGLSSSKRRLA
jgi:hypothetical protein